MIIIATTSNLQLEVFDPAEAAQVLVKDWVSYMSAMTGSNMTKIDTAVGNIMKYSTPTRTQITGNGVTQTFQITHTHNNTEPIVSVFNESGKPMFPEVSVVSSTAFNLIYRFPLKSGIKNNVIFI